MQFFYEYQFGIHSIFRWLFMSLSLKQSRSSQACREQHARINISFLQALSVLFDYLQFCECYSMAFSKDESPTNSELQPFVISLRGNNWNSSVNYDYILCGTCWHGEDNPSKISRWEEDQNVNRLSGIRVQLPSQKQYYWPWVCLVSWLLRVISIWQY